MPKIITVTGIDIGSRTSEDCLSCDGWILKKL
jgi:hypothetical protein